jgi:hypothetical protein
MQRRRYARFTFVLLGILAGCGSGGGGGGGNPVPVPTSTPTVAPTSTPTIAPSKKYPIVLSPTSIALAGSQQSTFTASEPGYSDTFTAQLDPACSGIVTLTQTSGTGPSATFTVNSGTSAGACNIYVTDHTGQQATLSVSVAQVNGVLQ